MLGDAGAYVLSFFVGYLILLCHNSNPNISPYFFITLLWYPCYENLFSILRKFKLNKSPIKPDNNHLHQLIFFYLKKKYKLKNIFANNEDRFNVVIHNTNINLSKLF